MNVGGPIGFRSDTTLSSEERKAVVDATRRVAERNEEGILGRMAKKRAEHMHGGAIELVLMTRTLEPPFKAKSRSVSKMVRQVHGRKGWIETVFIHRKTPPSGTYPALLNSTSQPSLCVQLVAPLAKLSDELILRIQKLAKSDRDGGWPYPPPLPQNVAIDALRPPLSNLALRSTNWQKEAIARGVYAYCEVEKAAAPAVPVLVVGLCTLDGGARNEPNRNSTTIITRHCG